MESKISTIQIRQSIKQELEKLKQKANDSYEDVIVNLINGKDSDKKELEEAYKEMYQDKEFLKENAKITKEFEAIEDFKDWEWD